MALTGTGHLRQLCANTGIGNGTAEDAVILLKCSLPHGPSLQQLVFPDFRTSKAPRCRAGYSTEREYER